MKDFIQFQNILLTNNSLIGISYRFFVCKIGESIWIEDRGNQNVGIDQDFHEFSISVRTSFTISIISSSEVSCEC